MQLNVCFGNLCSPIKAEESWTWAQTAKYLQDNVISDGTLLPTVPGSEATYELVRPGMLAQKWTPEMEITLGQASTQNEQEQEFDFQGVRNGPFQLYLYPRGALIAIVQDAVTHTLEWITFENPSNAAETVPGFLRQIDETVKNRRVVLSGVVKRSRGIGGRFRSMIRNMKRDMYELDATNQAIFEKWRAGQYNDPQFMPVVTVNSKLGMPLIGRLGFKMIGKFILISGGVVAVGFIIDTYAPEVSETVTDEVQNVIERVLAYYE